MSQQLVNNCESAEILAGQIDDTLGEISDLLVKAQTKCTTARHSNNNLRQLIVTTKFLIRNSFNRYSGGAMGCIMVFALINYTRTPPPPLAANQNILVPFEAMQRFDYKAAIVGFTELLKQDQSVTILGERAYCHYRLENYNAAQQDITQMFKLNPHSGRAYLLRGLLQKHMQQTEAALDSFRLAAHYGDPMAVHQIKLTEALLTSCLSATARVEE